MPGDWMSASTMPTRRPCRAKVAARFAVVFDLPVPPRKEWTETILGTQYLPSLDWRPLARLPAGRGAGPDACRAATRRRPLPGGRPRRAPRRGRSPAGGADRGLPRALLRQDERERT